MSGSEPATEPATEAATEPAPEPVADTGPEARVSSFELFFDLVFVFGVTQITGTVTEASTAASLGRGVAVFLILWWAWGSYAWLTNTVPTGETLPRLVILTAMAAMLVIGLAVPHAWGDGGVALGLGFLVVMTLHVALFVLAAENPGESRRAMLRLAATNLGAAVILVAAGLADGRPQSALWVAAIALCYAGPYLTGVAGFTVHPGHFVERHGLIVLIALGESVVAIGGGGDVTVDWGLAGTALVVMALIVGLWWSYFDHDVDAGEHALVAAEGPERARLARDIYSYLHILLVLGVVFAAVGIHEALIRPDEPLDPVFAAAFAGGVVLYAAGLGAIRLRLGGRPSPIRAAAALVALAVIPLAPHVDAVVTAGILAAVTLAVALADRPRARRVLESTA
jgi:low temperature requirement protein LtrA